MISTAAPSIAKGSSTFPWDWGPGRVVNSSLDDDDELEGPEERVEGVWSPEASDPVLPLPTLPLPAVLYAELVTDEEYTEDELGVLDEEGEDEMGAPGRRVVRMANIGSRSKGIGGIDDRPVVEDDPVDGVG